AALNLKPDDDSRAMVLVFTDGVDTASWLSQSQVIAGARRLGVVVHAVELSELAYRQLHFLPSLVEATGGREWSATSSRGLGELFTRAIDEMRARYLVTFYPKGAPEPGWHELKVDVSSRGEVRTRPGYFVSEGTR